MKLPSLFWLGLAIISAGAAGCSRRETKVEQGNRQQIIYIGNLAEPNDLDPQISDSQNTFNIIQTLFEGLTQYDAKTCEPVPAGAASWEATPDQMRWTFHLQRNAKWTNGDPVTAHDYIFAYRRMLSAGLGAEYAALLFVLKNGEAFHSGKLTDFDQVGAHAPDDYTLVLDLSHPAPYLAAMTSHSAWFPLNQKCIEKFGRIDERGSRWTRPENMVSNGYFTLTEWRPQQYIRVTKSPTYWDRDHIRLNEAYFYPIENEDAEERAFRAGQLHVTSTIPISKIAIYDKEHSEYFHPAPFLGQYNYRFNVNVPPLNDVRVRRALAMTIDREQIVHDVARGHQLTAGHFTPPDTAGFNATANVPHDPEAARKLLAEAGFPGGKGFPHLEIFYNTNEGHRQIAEAIQQMWRRELGVDVGLYNVEGKVWTQSMRTLNYQIARYAWIGDYLDPSTFLDIMASDNGNNQTGWKNAEYDELLRRANTSGSREERYKYYQRCEQILCDECPMAPIYFYSRNNLRLPAVVGWYGNLLDQHPLKNVYLDASAK